MVDFADTTVNVVNNVVDIRKDAINIRDDFKNREFADVKKDAQALFGDVKELRGTIKEIKQGEVNPIVKEKLNDILENGVTKQDLAVVFQGAAVAFGAEAIKEDPAGTIATFGKAAIGVVREFGSFIWDNTFGRCM